MKRNVLRAAVIPIASSKQTIEIDGLHAKVQAHAALPSIYVNLESEQSTTDQQAAGPKQPVQPEQPWDRFQIVRLQPKRDKRIVGDIKISPLGKPTQQQTLVPTDSRQLTGGWVKLTPVKSLEPGEYAVVERLGKQEINTFVWDFGVNPSAPANSGATKPQGSALPSQPQ